MKSFFSTRPFAQVGLLMIPIVICVYFLRHYSITYSQGRVDCPSQAIQKYQSPIVAIEFAQTPQDVENVLGCFSTDQIDRLDFANKIDYGFMFFYSLFLFLFLRVAYQKFKHQWLKWALILPFLAFFGDLIENLQLFELTQMYRIAGSSPEMATPLFILQVSTWTKWLSLALSLALCGLVFKNFNRLSRVIGLWCWIPVILGVKALWHDVPSINFFVLTIFLVFFIVIIWSWLIESKSLV